MNIEDFGFYRKPSAYFPRKKGQESALRSQKDRGQGPGVPFPHSRLGGGASFRRLFHKIPGGVKDSPKMGSALPFRNLTGIFHLTVPGAGSAPPHGQTGYNAGRS